jgi:hypothetical protein
MPRRVPVVKEVEGDVRLIVTTWLEWLERKERLTFDDVLTPRLSYLRSLVADLKAGLPIELDGYDLPGKLGANPRSKYTITNKLTEGAPNVPNN